MKRTGHVSLVLALGLLPFLPGPCGDDSSFEGQRLSGSVSSLEELATEVLAGLASADTSRLEAVRLTEHEHNELVWPELPGGQAGSGFPVDIAWRNITLRNRAALDRLLPLYRGRDLSVVDVECLGETAEFESFRVRTDCRVTLELDGERLSPRQLFRDVLVWDGEHKIFRYYEP